MHLRGHGSYICLWLAVALLAASAARAQAQQVSPAHRAALADAAAAKAFCASPEFQALRCGWASERELKLTAPSQCAGRAIMSAWDVNCATGARLVPDKLPAVLAGPGDHLRALSLACKGRIITRAVFQLLSAPEKTQGNAVYLMPIPVGALYPPPGYLSARKSATGLVRCKLQLPAGAEPEAARALKAREADCVQCSSDCPSEVGAWYSDAYTSLAYGCNDYSEGGYDVRFERIYFLAPAQILLAKFEACGDAGCFDEKYEAAKAKGSGG